jgi:CheY-like chemotaxis protein
MHRVKRIMIVEDEVIMAMYLEMALKREGFLVVGSVSTGEEAVDMAEQKRPDVILMDIRLAGNLDGIEAAREIGKLIQCVVIFLTGYSDPVNRQRAEELHPAAFMSKPFITKDLVAILNTLLLQ